MPMGQSKRAASRGTTGVPVHLGLGVVRIQPKSFASGSRVTGPKLATPSAENGEASHHPPSPANKSSNVVSGSLVGTRNWSMMSPFCQRMAATFVPPSSTPAIRDTSLTLRPLPGIESNDRARYAYQVAHQKVYRYSPSVNAA